jgi:putative endonuclease
LIDCGNIKYWTPAFAGVTTYLPWRDGLSTGFAMKQPCVYILASEKYGTLYIGVTSDLIKRVWEHKNDVVAGFTEQYGVHTLVWFEQHATMESAISREKALKAWKRDWKLNLIEATNAEWRDLYLDVI